MPLSGSADAKAEKAETTGTTTVQLVDGTYEIFRHYYGRPSRSSGPGNGSEPAATRGVLSFVVSLLERGATHVGVATDHVIESFRNDLWPGYKTSAGVPAELLGQFALLEDALAALGVTVWPMVELEADDALASAAALVAADESVAQVQILTPDKDLAQCVVSQRVVQLDSRSGKLTDEEGVRERFGINPPSVPDWLALVGDSADGFSGLRGWGRVSASAVLARYEHLDAIPDAVADWDPALRTEVRGAARLASELAEGRDLAFLFKDLATLRVDRSLLASVDDLDWAGPGDGWPAMCKALGDTALRARVERLHA